MPRRLFIGLANFLLLVLLSVSWEPASNLNRGQYLLLAFYTDSNNEITISLKLTRTINNLFFLQATFIPPSGYHLYSKDLPLTGTNGQGRPTLLVLPSYSRMQSVGEVKESVASYMVGYEPDGPLVYPDGPVTLTLQVKLPIVHGWVTDQISLTYTACSSVSCKIPTIGKLIQVRLPGALSVTP